METPSIIPPEDENPGTFWRVSAFEGQSWSQYDLFVDGEQKASILWHELGGLVASNVVGEQSKMLEIAEVSFADAVKTVEQFAGIGQPDTPDIPLPRKSSGHTL